jgi:hypothetical protein
MGVEELGHGGRAEREHLTDFINSPTDRLLVAEISGDWASWNTMADINIL